MGFHLVKIIIDHLQLSFAVIGGIHTLAESMGVT
jgi:hypothetical protein